MTAPITVYRSDTRPSLEEAQTFVGGYVELIWLGDEEDRQMLVREDGLLIRGLETNYEASALTHNCKLQLSPRGIVGPAMILSGPARWLGDTEEDPS